MMNSVLPEDAPSPNSHSYSYAVEDSVIGAADRDEMHQITEAAFNFFHDLDVDDSRGKAVYIQKLKHDDFQTMEVSIQLDEISEVPHPLSP